MPLVSIDDYLREQQKKQGTEFLSKLTASGQDVSQFKEPDGSYFIPIAHGMPSLAAGAAPPDSPNGFTDPLQRGLLGVGADLATTAAMGSQLLGSPDASGWFQQKANDYSARAAALPSAVPDIAAIKGPGDIATYLWERFAENVPMIASLLIPSGAASLVAKGITGSAKAARVAGWTGAFLGDTGLQLGESAQGVQQLNQDPMNMKVLGTGLGKAVLDFLPIFTIAKTMGLSSVLEKNFIARLAEKGYLKRVAGDALTIAAVEIPTEVAQEALDVALEKSLTGNEDKWNDQDIERLKNAAAGAAAVGLGMAPFAALGKPRIRPEAPPKVPDGVTPPEIPTSHLSQPLISGPANSIRPPVDYYVNPEGVTSSVFDSANFYDKKTGAMTITGKELRQALVESAQKLEYNSEADQIIGHTYDRTWRSVAPTWQADGQGGAKLGEEAQISLQGPAQYEVWAPGGHLGTFPDLQSAMRRGEEYAWERSPKVSINAEGNSEVTHPLDGQRSAADASRQENPPTETGKKVVAIEEARTLADQRVQPFQESPNEETLAKQMDPGLQKLLEDRTNILDNKELYRNDGTFSKSGEKQVSAVETRIQAYADKSGIPNPLNWTREHKLVKGDITNQLGTLSLEDEANRSRPKYKNLSKAEETLFDKLQEKEVIEGLTENEYSRMEMLHAKIGGEAQIGIYRKATSAELEQIQKDMNDVHQIMDDEIARVKGESRGRMPSLDAEGQYLFSRGNKVLAFPTFDIKELQTGVVQVSTKNKPVGYIYAMHDGKYSAFGIPREEGVLGLSKELQKPIKGELQWMNGVTTPEGRKAEGYNYSSTGSNFKHPDAHVMKERGEVGKDSPGDIWKAWPAWGSGSKEALGSFPSKEEAVKYLDQLFRPDPQTAQHSLGVFSSLSEAVGALRKDAVQNHLAAKSSIAGEMRKNFDSLTLPQLIKAISPILSNLKIQPKLKIVSLDQLQGKERSYAESSAGFIDLNRAGEITLVLDNLFSAEQAKRVLVHEMIAHYGLRAFLEPAELQAILREVLAYRTKEIRVNAEARGELGKFDSNFKTSVNLSLRDAEEFIAGKMEEAWIRWQAGDKDWTRDNLWEKPSERSLIDKIIAFFRRIFRRIGLQAGPEKWTDPEIASLLKDVALFLSGKLTGRNTIGIDAHWRTSVMRAAVGPRPLADAIPNMNSFSEVWGAKFATGFLTPLQMAERYNTPGASTYVDLTQKWWARKRDLTVDSVNIAEDWQRLPKREMNKFAAALFEIDSQSETLGRRLTDEEVGKILREEGVGQTAAALYPRVDKAFRDMLDKLQRGLELNALMEHTQDRTKAEQLLDLWKQGNHAEFLSQSKVMLGNLEVGGRLTEIQNEFDQLRSRNYFPHNRFGRYAIYVRAKEDLSLQGRDFKGPRTGEDGKERAGQVVHFETFENYKARESRSRDLVKEFPGRLYDVGHGIVSDAEFTFLGMPPSLYEALRGKLNLTEQQGELLKELYFTRSPGRAFLKHLVKRKGIEGFSQDALRVFATYTMNASNHIARVEYHRDMGNALNELKTTGSKMGDVAGLVRDYFAKHFEYIMNPAGDWASLRSLGFLWYLGFNVKSALVNLSQIPMVAYPYLASVYGDARTASALTKAYGTVVRMLRGQSVLDDAAQVDINRAIREGVIDQAQATELASIAETPVLQRLLPQGRGEKLLRDVAYYGSFLFRHGERFNRYVAFVASRELALQKGLKGEDAYLAARKAVQTTMFEYSKWNRPTFMRGKKSALFLFWNYMQHLQYLAWGGEGRGTAFRIWGMLLLTAGLQGLPFAEDILDLLDFSSTKAKELFGSKDPQTDLRLQLRELAGHLSDNPDAIMHGLARNYGLGPLHLLQLLGVPVPGTDISGSLSAGQVIPGVQQLTAPSRNPDQALGQAVMDGLGPIGGIGYNLWKAMSARDPDTWKVWERAMPTAMKSASQAVRRWDRGEESWRGGGAVAKFDPHDWEQRAELVANALGFQPARVGQKYEERSIQESMKQYWLSRRALVMENYAYAFLSKDPETMHDAKAALNRFNSEAISPQLKISTESLMNSLHQRIRRSDLREEGVPNENAFVGLYKRVSASFPQSQESSSGPTGASTPSPPRTGQ